MNLRYRPHARKLVISLGILVLLGWLVPYFLRVERYRHRLEVGLQTALKRPVTFGSISLRLLPSPGFVIDNVVVQEDPAFGAEPFAQVDRVVCGLRWRSLWRSRFDPAHLRLERPTLNVVRNARGEWNFEDFLVKMGIPAAAEGPSRRGEATADFGIDIVEGRINFKAGANKKPAAVTDVRGRLELSPRRTLVQYRLVGKPLRTDISLPTPGEVEFEGRWQPGNGPSGSLEAKVSTRRALLYNWVPLLTGRNPEIYGLVDAELHLGGSLRHLQVDGEARLSELHRWEQLPPSDPFPCTVRLRGQFDRDQGRVVVERLEFAFAKSRLRVSGTMDRIKVAPKLDFVVALERSRLEDVVALGRRLGGYADPFGMTGSVDGLLTIQGAARERRYGGMLTAREARLVTPSGSFPLSDVTVTVDRRGVRLAPARVILAPRVELVAQGLLDHSRSRPQYTLTFSAKAVPLRDLVRFGRAAGLHAVDNLDAQGIGTATFHLNGGFSPLARPMLDGAGEVRAARISIPGMTEPLNVAQARFRVSRDRVVIDQLVAVMGTSVFKGRLERASGAVPPWSFDIHVNHLRMDEALGWFDVLGRRRTLPLLEFLPGLGSLDFRRTSVSNPFVRWNAQGRFAASVVSYRALTLKDFQTSVTLANNLVSLSGASFRLAEAAGQATARLDLGADPVQLTGDVNLHAIPLRACTGLLPSALRDLRGNLSARGSFATKGRSWQDWADNLQGQVRLELQRVSFGDFDPLEALAQAGLGEGFEADAGETEIHAAPLAMRVHSRRILWEGQQLSVSGAKLDLSGSYSFEKKLDLSLRADLQQVKRRWAAELRPNTSRAQVRLLLSGPFDHVKVTPAADDLRAAQ